MKKDDIIVGNYYAYESYKGATRYRVKALQSGAVGKDWRGRRITGTLVQQTGGQRVVVPNREIACPWDEEQARRTLTLDNEARRLAESREGLLGRAEVAHRLERVLDAIGVERRDIWLAAGSRSIEPTAQNLADAGFFVYAEERKDPYEKDKIHYQFHVLDTHESAVDYARGVHNAVTIPNDSVEALLSLAIRGL